MLFWVTHPITLLESWSLIAMGHVEVINPLSVRLDVEASLVYISTQLYLDCIYNQVLDLLDDH